MNCKSIAPDQTQTILEREARRGYWVGGVLFLLFEVLVLRPIPLRADQKSDFNGQSLRTLSAQGLSEQNNEKRISIYQYLSQQAAPKTDDDLQFMNQELKSQNVEQRQRALKWLANTTDPALGHGLVNILRARIKKHSPVTTIEKPSTPELAKTKDEDEEVLGLIMLKVADLKQTSAISDIRQYAGNHSVRRSGLY